MPTPSPPAEPQSAPQSLAALQESFGKAIATPFLFPEEDGSFQLNQAAYPKEITDLIVPRTDLHMSAADRLGSYNCQYWFRLFTTVQKEFPLLRHLIGVGDLNKLTSAYLTQFPSTSYDLRHLTLRLDQFLSENEDYGLEVVRQAARLDQMFIHAFDAPSLPPIRPEEIDKSLMSRPLQFQPHWFLYEEHWELVKSRRQVADDDEDTLEVELKARPGYWAIWRSATGIQEEELGPLQYHLLCLLRDGHPIEEAILILSELLEEKEFAFLSQHIQGWFATWAAMTWIC